jgi:uncharacterized protein YaiE (UPF0345 family)
MVTEQLQGASVATKANVFFDGKCVSHTVTLANGAAEIMECVAGSCEYKVAGSTEWKISGPGSQFSVPANSSFDIKVAEAYHYICHFG